MKFIVGFLVMFGLMAESYDGIWVVTSLENLNTNLHYVLFGKTFKKKGNVYYFEISGESVIFLFPETKERMKAKFLREGSRYFLVAERGRVECFFHLTKRNDRMVSFGRKLQWDKTENSGKDHVNVAEPSYAKTLDQAQKNWDLDQTIQAGEGQ